ncbi:hypothetical protein [Teichococcus vastitatis]|uniref:Uncharacterized protein n=1 Tax=Teichococcus vastitatis TaxID=2307076 RepID=A0ABS9W8L0_9PROT|nr:hypothetical protein [Pseudoroseomonas vastitatis]MCI0755629.1 hypothetical protein [Pseudoroseomonas vastitatis]
MIGASAQHLLWSDHALRLFNIAMALLLSRRSFPGSELMASLANRMSAFEDDFRVL